MPQLAIHRVERCWQGTPLLFPNLPSYRQALSATLGRRSSHANTQPQMTVRIVTWNGTLYTTRATIHTEKYAADFAISEWNSKPVQVLTMEQGSNTSGTNGILSLTVNENLSQLTPTVHVRPS